MACLTASTSSCLSALCALSTSKAASPAASNHQAHKVLPSRYNLIYALTGQASRPFKQRVHRCKRSAQPTCSASYPWTEPLAPQVLTTEVPFAVTRRTVLALAPLSVLLATGVEKALAEPEGMQQAPSASFLKTFGIGDPDIYYPKFFEGTWDCFSTLVALETPQGEDMVEPSSLKYGRDQLNNTVIYQAKFVPHQGKVIAERLFTTMSLAEASVGKGVVVHGDWELDHPNRVTLMLKGGIKVESLVTKRAFNMVGPGRMDTSEFCRQVFDNPKRVEGPPTIKASQNVTRYIWDSQSEHVAEIEALQKVSMFQVPGEAFGGVDSSSFMDMLGGKPTTVYKYRVTFRRHQ